MLTVLSDRTPQGAARSRALVDPRGSDPPGNFAGNPRGVGTGIAREKKVFFLLDNVCECGICCSHMKQLSFMNEDEYMARVMGMPKPILCQTLEEAEAFAITKNRAVLVQIGDRIGRMTPNGDFRDLREAMEIVAKVMERDRQKEFGHGVSQADGKTGKPK